MNNSYDDEQVRPIDRREAIRRVSALLGGAALVGGRVLLAACERASFPLEEATLGDFTAKDIAFLDEIAETILPATKTPGAKAAKTGAFMALMVTDSYWPDEQRTFREGMRQVDDAMKKANGLSFMEATPMQRSAVLTVLDREQTRAMDARQAAAAEAAASEAAASDGRPAHYFRMMKELALLGYFTSEVGCKQALRYAETPGRFDPCVPYTPGEPAWADH
jgi:glucoside 3-dehydrogenase (cytochrome c) hitch-hiker subunit